MNRSGSFAAVDLGATSGRVILGTLRDGRMTLTETGRFDNTPQTIDGHLHWDFDLISSEIVKGLNRAIELAGGRLDSLGIDTWGVDYGRLDTTGRLIEHPFHYRDHRTDGVPEALAEKLGASALYEVAGLQVQPFNTIYQLVSTSGDLAWNACEQILLTPDLLVHHLTGVARAEMTIASTTGLLDVAKRTWSESLAATLTRLYGLPLPRVLPPLVEPGPPLTRAETHRYARHLLVPAIGEDGQRRPQNRGGKGLKGYNITAKTGRIAGVAIVDDADDIMLIENGGVLIRMAAADINIYGRDTQGVILMRLEAGSRVISVDRVDREPEEPAENQNPEPEISTPDGNDFV